HQKFCGREWSRRRVSLSQLRRPWPEPSGKLWRQRHCVHGEGCEQIRPERSVSTKCAWRIQVVNCSNNCVFEV
ncbi:hypothetical protein MCOR16_010123, partial [Pyricularia oryzae]